MGQCSGVCAGARVPGTSSAELANQWSKPLAQEAQPPASSRLPWALQSFRARGLQAVRSGPAGGAAEPLWNAACDIVDALLGGVLAHAPEVIRCVELGPASLLVRLNEAPLKGEFATRSRMGGELHLHSEVQFSFKPERFPSAEALQKGVEPLTLHISGFEILPLPECVALRRRFIGLFGEENFTPQAALSWWETNKDDFPPEHSKLRRIYESFLGKGGLLPRWAREKGLWGYVNAPPEGDVFESFEFWAASDTGVGAVTVTATLRPVACAKAKLFAAFCQQVLVKDRTAAERIATSSINYLAMVHARATGLRGACPRKIVKVFSAASHWGPGEDGWHQHDETWLCVDKKDFLGRTLEEQGRTIWRPLRRATRPGTSAAGSFRAAAPPLLAQRRKQEPLAPQLLLQCLVLVSILLAMAAGCLPSAASAGGGGLGAAAAGAVGR